MKTMSIYKVGIKSLMACCFIAQTVQAVENSPSSTVQQETQEAGPLPAPQQQRIRSCDEADTVNTRFIEVRVEEIDPNLYKKFVLTPVETETVASKGCIQRLKVPTNPAAGLQEICGEDLINIRVPKQTFNAKATTEYPTSLLATNVSESAKGTDTFKSESPKDYDFESNKSYDVKIFSPCDIRVSTSSENQFYGPLFKALETQRIRRLTFNSAKAVIVEGHVRLPGVELSFYTDQIVIKEGAQIDLTPEPYHLIPKFGDSGHGGVNGPPVVINTASFFDERTTKSPFIITRGGKGQDAGPASVSTASVNLEILEHPGVTQLKYMVRALQTRPSSRPLSVPLPPGLQQLEGHVVGWERIFHTEESNCTTFKRSFCNKTWEIGARGAISIEAVKLWKGGDAMPGGYPGVGGNGGHVLIQDFGKKVSYPENLVDMSPGESGKPADDAAGKENGWPRDIVILRAAPNHEVFLEEWHHSPYLKNAVSPREPMRKAVAGRIHE